MAECKIVGGDCFFTDRDNDNECVLDECKYKLEIKFKKNGMFTTKPVKTHKKEATTDGK